MMHGDVLGERGLLRDGRAVLTARYVIRRVLGL